MRDYKSSPDTPVYRNITKRIIEDPTIPQIIESFKDFVGHRAERYFGKASAGFADYLPSYLLAYEEELVINTMSGHR